MSRTTFVHYAPDATSPAARGRELRVAPRIACEIPVVATIDGQEYSTNICDISASGLAIFLTRAVELGEVYSLSFSLPTEPDDEISCAGLVRSYRDAGDENLIGMELHNLEVGARRSIADFIHWGLEAAVLGEQRPRWTTTVDVGTATLFDALDDERQVLRWTPGLPALFDQVAQVICELETVFVPTLSSSLTEGQQVYLEVIPPLSHAVFRMLGEVVWVERGAHQDSVDGVGLRLGGLSPIDRHLLESIRSYYVAEAARYQ